MGTLHIATKHHSEPIAVSGTLQPVFACPAYVAFTRSLLAVGPVSPMSST